MSDIAHTLRCPYHPIDVSVDDLCSSECLNELIPAVEAMWKDEVVDTITNSLTTSLQLADCYHHNNISRASFRSYLDVRIPARRIASTRAVPSTHAPTTSQLKGENGSVLHINGDYAGCATMTLKT